MITDPKTGARKKGHPRFVIAYGPWKWFLRSARFSAITMPWRSIYVLEEAWHDAALRYHERIHIEQMERDGTVRFCVLYLGFLIRYGYWRNPYEVEAYARTRQAFENAVSSHNAG